MIKVEVTEEFNLSKEKFDKLENIIRKDKEEECKLYKGDVFECDEKICKYLAGENALKMAVVRVIEIKKQEDVSHEEKEEKEEKSKKKGRKKIDTVE